MALQGCFPRTTLDTSPLFLPVMQQKGEWGSQGSTQACLRGLGPEDLEALAEAAGGGRVEPGEALLGARVMFTSVTRDHRAESTGCPAPVLAELCVLRKHEVWGVPACPGFQSISRLTELVKS